MDDEDEVMRQLREELYADLSLKEELSRAAVSNEDVRKVLTALGAARLADAGRHGAGGGAAGAAGAPGGGEGRRPPAEALCDPPAGARAGGVRRPGGGGEGDEGGAPGGGVGGLLAGRPEVLAPAPRAGGGAAGEAGAAGPGGDRGDRLPGGAGHPGGVRGRRVALLQPDGWGDRGRGPPDGHPAAGAAGGGGGGEVRRGRAGGAGGTPAPGPEHGAIHVPHPV